jgi:hypothetical protein
MTDRPFIRPGLRTAFLMTALALIHAVEPFQCCAQTASTSKAAALSSSGSTPSTVAIKKQFLDIERNSVQRDIKTALRCVETARLNLRDIQGNINRVARTDLLNCSRRLQILTRALQQLAGRGGRLGVEAEAEARSLEEYLRGISSNQDFPD